MKTNKLRMLLMQVEAPANTNDDELISLNDELAKNLVGVFGSGNGSCSGNSGCSNNGECSGNSSCTNNGTCNYSCGPKEIFMEIDGF